MTSSPFHIVIIGGGIGGLCLAQGLKKANISVAVYERNPANVWPEGYRIQINLVGSAALHDCLPSDLWEAFAYAAGKPPAGIAFLTEQLAKLMVEKFMSSTTDNPIEGHYPTNRTVLRHVLLAGMQDVVHFDKKFERYEQTADGKVTAFFEDGTSASGDILIGADGANSRVRKQYLPQAERVEMGAVGIAGKIPLTASTRIWLSDQLSTHMNLIMSLNKYSMFLAAVEHRRPSAEAWDHLCEKARAAGLDPTLITDNSQDYLLWAFMAPAEAYPTNAPSLDGCSLQHLVGEKIVVWHPTLRRVVAESDPQSVTFVSFKTSKTIAPWKSTNITLLGDAIHNMPPVGGLGGNMALYDARVLCRNLTAVQRGDLPLLSAIHRYEAEMRKYGFAAVRRAQKNTQRAVSPNRMARQAARVWFRISNAIHSLKPALEG